MRWFRFHAEALDDPKVQRLSPTLFKTWVNLLCIASLNEGKLPSIDDLAFKLRLSAQDAEQQISDLILVGLLDMAPDKSFAPHNWSKRQYASDDSKVRVRKFRETNKKRECNGDVTVTVTTPDSYTESDTDPNGLPSSLTTAREGKDLKGLNKFFEMKNDKKKERLHRRAEGLCLDVEELIEACNDHKAKNRPAYFTTLCVQRLQKKVKGLSEEVIRSALWDKSDEPYKAVIQAIMVAT